MKYPWGSRPKAASIFPAFRSCRRGCPWRFLQRPVPGPRHPGYFIARGFFLLYILFQTQSKTPDIQFLSLPTFTEDLLASFNTQDLADDPSTQDCRCVPRDLLKSTVPFRQVFARSFFKHIFLQLICQFVSQDSVQELPIRNQDSPYQGFW